MSITIPNKQTKQLNTNGESEVLGVLDKTFNIDLTSNRGRIRTTRMKKVVDSSEQSDLEIPVGFAYFGSDYYCVTGDFVYKGGLAINDTFTKVTDGSAPNGDTAESLSDIKNFNDAIYISGKDSVFKYDGSWSEPVTTGLTTNRPHLMEVYGNKLYITNDFYKIHHITTADAIVTSGAATLDLGLDDSWSISMLKAGTDRIWIGLVNSNTGKGLMYEWDGGDTQATRSYDLYAGVVAGIVKNNIPYYMDTIGRLMAYNGATFVEVDRLPREDSFRFGGSTSRTNLRYIHPNGMTTTSEGKILILIKNSEQRDDLTYENKVPSGIWEFDEKIGLYHRYSISTSENDDSGTSNTPDFGQQRLSDVGALEYLPTENFDSDANGQLLAGAEYFTDATTEQYGIFCDDTIDTTQKYGYFETAWLESDQIDDVWQKIVVKNKKLIHPTDAIVVKYRVDYDEPTEATITWSNINTFTTTSDLSSYVIGDEVECVQGFGSGMNAHITSISESGGTYTVVLDENFFEPYQGEGQTAKVLLSKWIKLGKITDQNKQWSEFMLSNTANSTQIKLKIGMRFTGRNELQEINVVNRTNTKI